MLAKHRFIHLIYINALGENQHRNAYICSAN